MRPAGRRLRRNGSADPVGDVEAGGDERVGEVGLRAGEVPVGDRWTVAPGIAAASREL